MKKLWVLALIAALLLSGCKSQKGIEISGDHLATTAYNETAAQEETGTEQTTAETAQATDETAQATQTADDTSAAEQRAPQKTPTAKKGNGGTVFLMIVLLLISGAGLYFSYLIPKRQKERRRAARARQAARRAQAAKTAGQQDTRKAVRQPEAPSEQQPMTYRDGHWE